MIFIVLIRYLTSSDSYFQWNITSIYLSCACWNNSNNHQLMRSTKKDRNIFLILHSVTDMRLNYPIIFCSKELVLGFYDKETNNSIVEIADED